jgi:hypothetical protein
VAFFKKKITKNSNNHNIVSKLLKLIKFSIQFDNLKKNRERNVSIVSLILKKIPPRSFQLTFQVQFIQKSGNLKKIEEETLVTFL